jgi:hypothetical protein
LTTKKEEYFLYIITDNSSFLCPKRLWKGNDLYKTENTSKLDAMQVCWKQTSILQNCILTLNCYYKLNKVAPAIYSYEKALVLSPNDKEILNNLKFAQKELLMK